MRSAPHPELPWMLVLSTTGMLLGLWLDGRSGALPLPADWCGGGAAGWGWREWRFHWLQAPGMHLGMLLGGLSALPWLHRRVWPLACSLACCIGMSAGMGIAAGLGARLPGASAGLSITLMLAGMGFGMAASRALMSVAERIAAHDGTRAPRRATPEGAP